MPTEEEILKRRYREFVDLLPLTTTIAGLAASAGSFNYSPEQMELRTQTLSTAFKLARQMLRDALAGG